jgi:tetratricopeptide (TPR) repeat protein
VQRAGTHAPTSVDRGLAAMLETALDVAEDLGDRARLQSALAQELIGAPGSDARRRGLSDAAVADARQMNDPAVLSEVLSRRVATLRSADALTERDRASAENVRMAAAVADPQVRWAAVRTRLHVAVELGDLVEITERLEQLRAITDETGAVTARFGLAVDECWHHLLAGRLAEAEAAAEAALSVGSAAANPLALVLYLSQLVQVRMAQGRAAEMAGVVDAALRERPDRGSRQAVLAQVLCAMGRLDEARALLDANLLRLDDTVDSHWLTAACLWANVAASTGHSTAAGVLRARLLPYADQICFNSCWVVGAVTHSLARLSRTLDDVAHADAWQQRAAESYRRLDAPLLLAELSEG